MGNPFLLQACLRLDKDQLPEHLEIGKKYKFSKDGHRLYQLNVAMDLRDKEWKVYGRCVVTEYTVGHDKTTGEFVMVKIYNEEQSRYATESYISDEEVIKILNS
jgi:hypothetical protein